MDISVTEFKHRCLDLVRGVERSGRVVTITRRGKVVARLVPCQSPIGSEALSPWEEVRAIGGTLLADPCESVLNEEEFEALR